jgi:hypothetical protein
MKDKTPQKIIIDEEEYGLEQAEGDLIRLKAKWFKTSSTFELIEFLKMYTKEKEKFIKILKQKECEE